MNGEIEKGELYRIDSQPYEDTTEFTWLERIVIKEGYYIDYTENYVEVHTSQVDFMILEGSILTNY